MKHDEGKESIDHEKKSSMTELTDIVMKTRVTTDEDIKNLPNVGNSICPVTGNPIDDASMGEAVKYLYNGNIYNLCCQMCVKGFKMNSE